MKRTTWQTLAGKPHVAILLVCFMGSMLTCTGEEWFVDKTRPNDDGDGRSEATAKRTIQAAVNAASQGDTITVLPGDYDEGLTEIAAGSYKYRTRVYISKKNIVLRSRDGAAVTHIVGQHDPATEANSSRRGIGDNAIRCVMFTNNTDAANCIVKGFTIRDGASAYVGSENYVTYGGGVFCPGYQNGSSIAVMDCVISNCVAMRGGGAANVSLVRSLVTCCRASNSGAADRYLWAYNCVFSKNRYFLGTMEGVCVLTFSPKIVNCDIVENDMYTIDSNTTVWNSLFFGNQGDASNGALSSKCYNCLSDISTLTANDCFYGTYTTSVFAPAAHDFRVVSGGAADGSGNVSYLTSQITTAAYRDTDYYGNPRKTGDSVNVGAVEGRAVSRGRFVFSKEHKISVNGLPELVRNSHVNVEAVPCPIRIRIGAAADETREIIRIKCSDNSHSFFPEWDGSFVVTPFKAAAEYSIMEIVRGKTVYADADATGAVEDGSAENPYHTLQAAVDDVGNDNGVVLLRRGHYNKGERLSAGTVSNRCCFAGSGYCVVRSLEGPSVTFVHGKSASTSSTGDGRGEGAVRCLEKSGSGDIIVVGLTVCDGRVGVTANDADGHDVRGGAVYRSSGGNGNMYLVDCVISNNLATRGGVGFASAGTVVFIRCRITGNRTPGNALLRNCIAVNSLFYGNGAEGETCTAIGQTASAYNCTVYGSAECMGFEAGLSTKVANSVFVGATFDKVSASSGNKVANTVYVTTSTEQDLSANEVIQGDPVLTAPANGDFRLTTLSPARSLAAFSQSFNQMNFPLDAFGNAYTVDAEEGSRRELSRGLYRRFTYPAGAWAVHGRMRARCRRTASLCWKV